MPRRYIDAEWDRDALFATRNLVTIDFAAEQLKVSGHAIEKAARGVGVEWVRTIRRTYDLKAMTATLIGQVNDRKPAATQE